MTNRVFEDYRNKYAGESVILFASGPSLKLYLDSDFRKNNLDKDIVKIGCNSILKIGLELDYYFTGDPAFTGFKSNPESHLSPPVKKQKFCREAMKPYLGKYASEFKLYKTSRYEKQSYSYIPLDIVKENINQVGTISMDMVQFALFAGFKKIFLIGQDCNYSQKGQSTHFGRSGVSNETNIPAHRLIRSWGWINSRLKTSFRGVEVYIINPVSLTLFPTAKLEDIIKL